MPTSASDGRGKWRRRPRDSKPTNSKRHRPEEEEDDEEEEENEAAAAAVEADEDEDLHPNPNSRANRNPAGASRRSEPATAAPESEVLSDGVRISDFPVAVRRTVDRPHPSVVALSVAERAAVASDAEEREKLGGSGNGFGVVLENISYGQLQVMSAVPADNPALVGETESSGSYVATPPPIMEGRGVVKRFWDGRVHVVPMHADWFTPTTVNRLERQVVPHFFSGKSMDHSPEKYLDCRNLIVAKYMENPDKRLSLADCQGIAVGIAEEDMNRIFRFLDNWGIINYCASSVPNYPSWNVGSYLRENVNGELHVPSAALKSIDSLIRFDKPKCRLKPSDVYPSVSSVVDDPADLDYKIREKLSENHCSHCSRPVLLVYFQSLKDADKQLCTDCYHEGRFVVGHSSIDFTRVDSAKDIGDIDAENWTDQETLLLLEAVEMFNDNWNEIADYVGSKSKAQCILQFLRLPMEDGLLENFDIPSTPSVSNVPNRDANGGLYLNSNGNSSGTFIGGSDSDSGLPFANSGNPVMSLVAFLASSVGPRVAAACAHAALAALSDNCLLPTENTFHAEGSAHGNRLNSEGVHNYGQHKEENVSSQVSRGQNSAEVYALSDDKVNSAAKAGLAAAALKAKLFGDHEEREVQRLSANIINHQLKRLELKLKQFAEVETLLMKECEQVERARQRLAADRARILSSRFGPTGVTSPSSLTGMGSQQPSMVNTNNIVTTRPHAMSSSQLQPQNISGFNNHPQLSHPNVPSSSSFMPRQQPMFSFGPRLPLSAIQPSTSTSSPSPSPSPSLNAMFSSQGGGGGGGHPILRPVSGTSSGLS